MKCRKMRSKQSKQLTNAIKVERCLNTKSVENDDRRIIDAFIQKMKTCVVKLPRINTEAHLRRPSSERVIPRVTKKIILWSDIDESQNAILLSEELCSQLVELIYPIKEKRPNALLITGARVCDPAKDACFEIPLIVLNHTRTGSNLVIGGDAIKKLNCQNQGIQRISVAVGIEPCDNSAGLYKCVLNILSSLSPDDC